jgi:hypothetical protein
VIARLSCTGSVSKLLAICGSAVASTVPSKFSMKSAQATISAMICGRSMRKKLMKPGPLAQRRRRFDAEPRGGSV